VSDADPPERLPEHIAVYQRIRRVFGDASLRSGDARRRKRAARDETSVPYGLGRDPRGIADVMENLTSTMGWDSPLARADLLASWSEIVGDETAAHAAPIGIEEGVLTVRCDSTAWATHERDHHHEDHHEARRRRHRVRALPGAGRPLLETWPQSNPRAGSTRYLRLTRQIWSSAPRKVPRSPILPVSPTLLR
jgi:hypothetical protein